MSDIYMVSLTFGVGALLGVIFYGGLWITVQKGLSSRHAPLWFLASFWLRLAIVISGFYVMMQGDWKNLLVCLGGFLAGRVLISLLTKGKTHATQP